MNKIYKFIFFIFLFISLSCSSTSTFNQFYNKHKNDNNVSSFQVPGYLKSIIKKSSPEMNELLKNVKDFKTMSFTNCSTAQSKEIARDIDLISKKFTDVVRNNKEENKTLITVKEKNNIIKKVIIYKTNGKDHKLLFLKGNFDSNRINELANSNDFLNLK